MSTDHPDDARRDKPEVLSYQTPGGIGESWVTIFKARNSAEANLAVAALQAREVRARVDFENTASLGAWAGAGSGTVTGVQVLAHDASAARAIIDELESKKAARREAALLKCPRCGTAGPKRLLAPERIVGLVLIVLGLGLSFVHAAFCVPLEAAGIFLVTWPTKPKWRCLSCGHTWRAAEPEEVDEEDDDVEETS
jgi:hypothetical protein